MVTGEVEHAGRLGDMLPIPPNCCNVFSDRTYLNLMLNTAHRNAAEVLLPVQHHLMRRREEDADQRWMRPRNTTMPAPDNSGWGVMRTRNMLRRPIFVPCSMASSLFLSRPSLAR
jgi:hypothetical protein